MSLRGFRRNFILCHFSDCICFYFRKSFFISRYYFSSLWTAALKLKIEKWLCCYGVSMHGKDEVDRVGGITKAATRRDVLKGDELIESRDIASNAVTKPGKIPTKFHVVPESHYKFITESYRDQPDRTGFGIKQITDLQMIYFNASDYKKITIKPSKKDSATSAYELNIKTSRLTGIFEPEKWPTEKFKIHGNYADTKRFEYSPENFSNAAYNDLSERLKVQLLNQ